MGSSFAMTDGYTSMGAAVTKQDESNHSQNDCCGWVVAVTKRLS